MFHTLLCKYVTGLKKTKKMYETIWYIYVVLLSNYGRTSFPVIFTECISLC